MTVIRPNSISGINSITAQGGDITYFKSDGTAGNQFTHNIQSTGVVTATKFVGPIEGAVTGSGANLTSIPAGQLTGTVADARLSTVSSSKLSGALPALDGSALTGVGASFGNSSVNTSGIITATQVKTLNGTSSLNQHSVGIGTTTTAGRNAGVSTATGTIVYNTSSGQLEVYTGNKWVAVYEPPFEATGGTKNTSSRSGYAVHTFTSPGTFTVSGSPQAGGEYLIVGGGGGGGKGGLGGTGFEVGGGGGGGHRFITGHTFTPGTYAVVVGSGGPGGGTGDGQASSAFGQSAAGGGGGCFPVLHVPANEL